MSLTLQAMLSWLEYFVEPTAVACLAPFCAHHVIAGRDFCSERDRDAGRLANVRWALGIVVKPLSTDDVSLCSVNVSITHCTIIGSADLLR